VISRKALVEFWTRHPAAKGPLARWFKVVEDAEYVDFSGVRQTFNSADKVGDYVIFDVGSNRIVTVIHFGRGRLYIRQVFTHTEYDAWSKRLRRNP
jgi:mRNA interferase HigB